MRELLLDTNLLILVVVGSASESYIARHKNLSACGVGDFRRVTRFMQHAKELIFVPNVVTETFNLLRQVDEPLRTDLTRHFGALLKNAQEIYVASKEVVDRAEFPRLGLTDAVLMKLAETGADLLTAGLGLYLEAARSGLRVINYNHIRDSDPEFNPWAR